MAKDTMTLNVEIICLLGILQLMSKTNAVGTLISVPETTDGVLTVCPGDSISITCTHSNATGQLTRWILPGVPSTCTVVHDGSLPPNCSPFTITMISNSSGSTLSSTAQIVATESLNSARVECLAGGLLTSPQVGNITIRVIGSPSVPTTGPIEYSVESANTGRVRFTVSSAGMFGTAVTFGASVTGENGTVQVTGNNITVTDLDYNNHTVMVTATSVVCPRLSSNAAVSISFKLRTPLLSQPVASVMCLLINSELPINVSWTVEPGAQTTTDPNTPLVPPPTATPTISYSSTGGRSGNTSSDSPYLLTDTVRNDMYTFTVTVTNVAGASSKISNVLAAPLRMDQGTVSTSYCLNVNSNCLEDITNGDFRVQLLYAFGSCRTLLPSQYDMLNQLLSAHSLCLPVGSAPREFEFCYRASLLHGDTVINTITNLSFNTCSIAELQTFLGAGVSYQLDGVESGGSVSHLTTATLSCGSVSEDLSGASHTICTDGVWDTTEMRSCSVAGWVITVIVIIILILVIIGIFLGLFVGLCFRNRVWHHCTEGQHKNEGDGKEIEKQEVGGIQLSNADLDVAASHHKPKPAPQLPTQEPAGQVEYSIVDQEHSNL